MAVTCHWKWSLWDESGSKEHGYCVGHKKLNREALIILLAHLTSKSFANTWFLWHLPTFFCFDINAFFGLGWIKGLYTYVIIWLVNAFFESKVNINKNMLAKDQHLKKCTTIMSYLAQALHTLHLIHQQILLDPTSKYVQILTTLAILPDTTSQISHSPCSWFYSSTKSQSPFSCQSDLLKGDSGCAPPLLKTFQWMVWDLIPQNPSHHNDVRLCNIQHDLVPYLYIQQLLTHTHTHTHTHTLAFLVS